MSRLGKRPIAIPSGVEVEIDDNKITVKGPKGTLTREINRNITLKKTDQQIIVERTSDDPASKALHGLTRALIANMVEGVSAGFQKELEISGVGYRAQKSQDKLILNVGYSHPVELKALPGVDFEVPEPTRIRVFGIDKQLVGQFAAQIRAVKPPEPYIRKQPGPYKGIKYLNETLKLKPGKAGKVAAK